MKRMMRTLFGLLLTATFFGPIQAMLGAVGTFIAAPGRVDVVHDARRDILYISSGEQVLRYSLTANGFLSPFNLGGNLSGIDLSPDGNLLAVADRAEPVNGVNRIHLVDLTTGTDKVASFSIGYGESGTYTVAFAADGMVLVSSLFSGSGWVPLRLCDPKTGGARNISNITQNTMLTASADGQTIALAQANISSGPVNRYSSSAQSLSSEVDTGWFNYEVGVSRDGSQIAAPTYGGTYIYDRDFKQIGLIGQYASGQPVGVVYSPVADAVFFSWVGSSEVRAYHSVSLQELARYDVGTVFQSPGNGAFREGRLKMSRDGRLLFCTVNGGVQYFAPELTVPAFDLAHRLVIASDPAGFGTPSPLPFGTNWLQAAGVQLVSASMSPSFETNGIRYLCTGWEGTGDVPTTGTGTSATFVVSRFSQLTWKWAIAAYKMTANVQGNGQVDIPGGWFSKGSVVTVSALPAPGYRLEGWTGNIPASRSKENPLILTIDGPVNLTATFVPDVVSLSILASPAGIGAPTPQSYGTLLVPRNSVVTNRVNALATNSGALYAGIGWTGTGDVPSPGVGNSVVFPITRESTLTWNWQLTAFRLTSAVLGNGSITPASGWYPVNSQVALSPNPDSQNRFDHWVGDLPPGVTNQVPLVVSIDRARSITAVFVPDTLQLVVEGDPVRAGIPLGSGYGTNFVLRNTIVTNQVPKVATNSMTRFVSTGWTGTGDIPTSGSGTAVVFALTQNSRLVWKWTATDYWLEAGVAGAGSVTLGSGWFSTGAIASLQAAPAVNYRFDHWAGDVDPALARTNPLSLTMDRPRSVVAVFVADTLELVVTAEPTRVGTPSPYGYGTNFVLRGTSFTNRVAELVRTNGITYRIQGWAGTGDLPETGDGSEAPLTVTQNSTLTWHWLPTEVQFTANTNGPGRVTAASGWVPIGSTLTLEAVPADHFRFDHWAGDLPAGAAQSNPLTLTLDRPRQVIAYFVPDLVVFQVGSTPTAFGAPNPDSYGTHAILRGTTVTNRAGTMGDLGGTRFVCTGWNGTGDVAAHGTGTETVFVLTQPSSIEWLWKPVAKQLVVSTAGLGRANLTNEWFAIGSSAGLEAIPAPGHKFVRWYGDVPPGRERQNPIELVMSEPHSVIAYFVPDGTATAVTSGDWTTFGGGPEHTGYAASTLGNAIFSQAWSRSLGVGLQAVAVGGGAVYASTSASFGSNTLWALHEFSGQVAWNYVFSPAFSLNPPAYDSGAVFVQRGDHELDTQLWSFDASTGQTNWVSRHGAQWEHYLAPTVSGGRIYIDGGSYGGMYGFDEKTGSQLFFQNRAQYDQWTPTASAGRIYSWVGGEFAECDPITGQTLRSVNLGWNWSGWTTARTVAIHDGLACFTGNSQLYVLDTTTLSNVWTLPSGFSGTPAIANGVVYAIENDTVKAFLARTGDLLGKFVARGTLLDQPLVTDDALIVSSDSATYVFDLGSYAIRQTLPVGGRPALAHGMLFVAGTDNVVHAFSAGATRLLTVNSNSELRGSPTPASYGLNSIPEGTALVEGVNSPVKLTNGLYLVATGWTGTGSVPPTGNGNEVRVVLTEDSTLTWNWELQALLSVTAGAHGRVDPPGGGYKPGSTVVVNAIPEPFYHFTGWTGGVTNQGNPLTVNLETSLAVQADFAPDLVVHGVPVSWLAENQLELTDAGALADSDGDGIANWEEYLSGTDPRDATSLLRIASVERPLPNQMILRWTSAAGRKYRIWASSDPGFAHRELVTGELIATPPLNNLFIGMSGSARYFRIELAAP